MKVIQRLSMEMEFQIFPELYSPRLSLRLQRLLQNHRQNRRSRHLRQPGPPPQSHQIRHQNPLRYRLRQVVAMISFLHGS